MSDCVFCKIVEGDIASHKIYEDDHVLAFLDIDPISNGQTVVIPKAHSEFLWDMEDGNMQLLMTAAKVVARRLKSVLETERVVMLVEGVDVAHSHVVLIPLNTSLREAMNAHKSVEPDHEKLAELATKISL